MALNNTTSKALKELIEQIAHEEDPGKLRELVVEISGLLDLIEKQVAKIEHRSAN
ncbi:MAG TPA: hypothetical protein VLW06_10755 [Terriglobales bacterium]|nr:hypothetical protein [Terriglobales bacterium]